jgi:hypothetical protein
MPVTLTYTRESLPKDSSKSNDCRPKFHTYCCWFNLHTNTLLLLLFMSRGRYHVSELRPLTGLLFIRRYMSVEIRGGMILTGKNRRTRRKTCPSATLSTINPTMTDLGLHYDRPATNRLSNESGEPKRNDIGRGTEKLGEKLVLVPLCPLPIPQ